MSSSSKKTARPRRGSKQEMRAAFERLVEENPRLADATLTALRIVAGADRQSALQLVETFATIVISAPRKARGPGPS